MQKIDVCDIREKPLLIDIQYKRNESYNMLTLSFLNGVTTEKTIFLY